MQAAAEVIEGLADCSQILEAGTLVKKHGENLVENITMQAVLNLYNTIPLWDHKPSTIFPLSIKNGSLDAYDTGAETNAMFVSSGNEANSKKIFLSSPIHNINNRLILGSRGKSGFTSRRKLF